MSNQEFVELTRFSGAAEAHSARMLLDSKGIDCRIEGDELGDGLFGGHTRLLVRDEDAAAAREILLSVEKAENTGEETDEQ